MTNIKERILYFVESQGIKKEDFFNSIEKSYSNFKGKQKDSGLNSDTIAIILTKYSQLNSDWLLTGNGEMLKKSYAIGEELNIAKDIEHTYNKKENSIDAIVNGKIKDVKKEITKLQIELDEAKKALQIITRVLTASEISNVQDFNKIKDKLREEGF